MENIIAMLPFMLGRSIKLQQFTFSSPPPPILTGRKRLRVILFEQ